MPHGGYHGTVIMGGNVIQQGGTGPNAGKPPPKTKKPPKNVHQTKPIHNSKINEEPEGIKSASINITKAPIARNTLNLKIIFLIPHLGLNFMQTMYVEYPTITKIRKYIIVTIALFPRINT